MLSSACFTLVVSSQAKHIITCFELMLGVSALQILLLHYITPEDNGQGLSLDHWFHLHLNFQWHNKVTCKTEVSHTWHSIAHWTGPSHWLSPVGPVQQTTGYLSLDQWFCLHFSSAVKSQAKLKWAIPGWQCCLLNWPQSLILTCGASSAEIMFMGMFIDWHATELLCWHENLVI